MPAPYTEGDIADAFVALTDATGAYLDVLETRGVARDVYAQLEREARSNLNEVHRQAADIVAWLSAVEDDEIDDTVLDDAFDLDEDDDDDLDDLDDEE
jgi:hypothetical protein